MDPVTDVVAVCEGEDRVMCQSCRFCSNLVTPVKLPNLAQVTGVD